MKSIAVIYGTEEYLMERQRRQFLEACRNRAGGEGDVQVFTKDAVTASVVESFEGESLFGGGGITVWQDCPFLPLKRGGRSRSKLTKDETWFLQKLSGLDPQKGVLFYTKGNLDTGCAFFKQLKPLAQVFAGEAVTEKNVMPYIVDFFAEKGKQLTQPAVQYLRSLFQTWSEISLTYVFSELEKVCITLDEGQETVGPDDLTDLFSGTMEKNLFTFTEYFLHRDGRHAIPFIEGLFSRQDSFLKNTGFMLSRLRLLLAYKELKHGGMGPHQTEAVLTKINKGRSVRYVLYRLQKAAPYWKIEELYDILDNLFILQRNIRRGTAAVSDMAPLICLYCGYKGRN